MEIAGQVTHHQNDNYQCVAGQPNQGDYDTTTTINNDEDKKKRSCCCGGMSFFSLIRFRI